MSSEPHDQDSEDTADMDEVERAARANRLYWGSESGVNRIADDLGLSKGALYELVQPLPSELPCPRCGTEMAYPNRTAREKGFLTCPACEVEEDEEVIREALVRGDLSRPPSPPTGRRHPALTEPGTRDGRVLAGTALLGIAVGIVIGSLIGKR